MRRAILKTLGGYLVMGMVLGLIAQPQQVWFCPDADAPHGGTWGSSKRSEACEATVTVQERATFFAIATVAWLPVAVLKGLAED